MTTRYLCIHGHFYQPPRENPWLEAVEVQDSAVPFHDWNERVTAECYAPNAAARIVDGEGYIVHILNNYSRMSFNFGPTLLAWLEEHDRETYRAVLEADRESRARFDGHGSALAQVYNHMILPLATRRDKVTQVRWGLRDFERRFGRPAEGMWLPETAVDLETLEVLAENGVRFTVLAPHQARRVRLPGGEWREVGPEGVDPRRAYRTVLPSGREVALFFYDGLIARAVAFEGLLSSGEAFARRLLEAFRPEDTEPQLVHIATDGETYGHHHRFGEMALAYALHHLEEDPAVRLTNYAAFLIAHPPEAEVEIAEATSWSCPHGVERWRADCGCRAGRGEGWSQAWRAPLREALDWLREELAPRYEAAAAELVHDPWGARDDYIDVILDRSPESLEAFLARHARRPLGPEEKVRLLQLLEMQRHALLMYTSCGWFFDEISDLETVQVLRYADRALALAEALFGVALESEFESRLAAAPSNRPEYGDGRGVYRRLVRPSRVAPASVVAHHVLRDLVEEGSGDGGFYAYQVEVETGHEERAGRARLQVGRARVASTVTLEGDRLEFAALHLGDHNLRAGVRPPVGEAAYEAMAQALVAPFERGDLAESVRALEAHFPRVFALGDLFADERRRVIERLLQATMAEAEQGMRALFDRHAPLMRYLADLGIPIPAPLKAAAAFVLDAELRQALSEPYLDPARLEVLFAQVERFGVTMEAETLRHVAQEALERGTESLLAAPWEVAALERLEATLALLEAQGLLPDLWRVQNGFYALVRSAYPTMAARAAAGEMEAGRWLAAFRALGRRLRVRVEQAQSGE